MLHILGLIAGVFALLIGASIYINETDTMKTHVITFFAVFAIAFNFIGYRKSIK